MFLESTGRGMVASRPMATDGVDGQRNPLVGDNPLKAHINAWASVGGGRALATGIARTGRGVGGACIFEGVGARCLRAATGGSRLGVVVFASRGLGYAKGQKSGRAGAL